MRIQGGSVGDEDRLKRMSDLGSSGLAMEVEANPESYSSAAMVARVSTEPAMRSAPFSAPAEQLEQVLKFLTSPEDRPSAEEPAVEPSGSAAPKRDLRSALELSVKVFEAVRAADARLVASEEFQKEMIELHEQQVHALEGRISASEKRLKEAEARARDAEVWLAKFHDNIVEDFQRTFASR